MSFFPLPNNGVVASLEANYAFSKVGRKRRLRRWDKFLKKYVRRIPWWRRYPVRYKKETSWRLRRKQEREKRRAQELREQQTGEIEKFIFEDAWFWDKDTRHAIRIFRKKWRLDLHFFSYWFSKFINKITQHGFIQKAEFIAWSVLSNIKKIIGRAPLLVLFDIFSFLKPVLTLISKNVGVRVYKIPIQLADYQSIKLTMKWLIHESRLFFNRTEKRRSKAESKVKANEKPLIGLRSKKQRRLSRNQRRKRKKGKKKSKPSRSVLILKRTLRRKFRSASFIARLTQHLLDVLLVPKVSSIVKKKKRFQKLLNENQLYLHYRWLYTH